MSETKDEINDSLLEWLASWIYVVKSAKFNNQLKSTLPDLFSFVHAPLARELCQLFVVSAQYNLMRLFGQVFSWLYVHALLDEKTKSSNYSFLS